MGNSNVQADIQADPKVKQAIDKVLEMASGLGVEGSDVIASQSSSMSFRAAGGKLDEYKISQGQVLGVRVVKDNKVGLAYSESLDDDALKYMVSTAVSNSQFSKENNNEKIAVTDTSSIECVDELLNQSEEVSVDEQIKFALSLESEVMKKDDRVRNAPYNALTKSQSRLYIGNSAGRFCYHTEKNHSCYTSALMTEGDQNAMHYHAMVARRFQDLRVDEVVNESVLHAGHFLKAKSIPSGKYDVVFDMEIWHQLFGNFHSTYSAKGAMENLNPWKDKLNTKVMDERFNVIDDPLDKTAAGYTLFDSEGHTTKSLNLIENGVLANFYQNTATAKHFKTDSTGHASRGPKSGLGVSGTNIKIGAGETKDSEILSGRYFKIVAIQGLGSGSDALSGDFSFAASGYLYEGDTMLQAVKEVTLSGNFYEVMLNNIQEIGDTVHSTYDRSFFSPLIRFKDLVIAG